MIRAAVRRLLYWAAPSLSLGDRAFVEAAALRADVAALSLRLRVAEHSLAEWQRQAKALTQVIAIHQRDIAIMGAKDVSAQGGLAARVALLELTVMPPIADCAATDGRLDAALEDMRRRDA